MSVLGLYFGSSVISLVESKGKHPINITQVPLSIIAPSVITEEKVPEEIKLVALLKDELIANKIEAKEATIVLSGKDMIIRNFEIPLLPKDELEVAVNFEVKKYIPFRPEDLVSDFQYKRDKANRKSNILFAGIKKEALNKYIYILTQLGLKINSIEYSAFSTLRLLQLSNINAKGVIALVAVDLVKDDETNFVVLEDGFPLFSRDIAFISGSHEAGKLEVDKTARALEKLKRELRISLDYYNRRFSSKAITQLFFVTGQDYQLDIDAATREIGLPSRTVDISKYLQRSVTLSMASVRAYSGSLSEIKAKFTLNLLAAREKAAKRIDYEKPLSGLTWGIRLRSNINMLAWCSLTCALFFLFGLYRTVPIKKELNKMMVTRPQLAKANANATYDELNTLYAGYKQKLGILNNFIEKQLYLTEILNIMPRLVTEGVWFTNLSFINRREERVVNLTLEGRVSAGDNEKEINLVNGFLAKLKEAPVFKYFQEINILSVERIQVGNEAMTRFVILCQAKIRE